MNYLMENFVNLGDNCEFGFVQSFHKSNDSNLFRWALTEDFQVVTDAINSGFPDLYSLENLIPKSLVMVTDMKYRISFHTKIPIEQVGATFRFVNPGAALDIHQIEAEKFRYMAAKFLRVLATEPKIYVAKHRGSARLEPMQTLLRALRAKGDAALLYVTHATISDAIGTVRRVEPNLYLGFIDRFSDYLTIDDISIDVWTRLCEKTWRMHRTAPWPKSVHGRLSLLLQSIFRKDRAEKLPDDFDPSLYLQANPDVAQAGVDAREHYLKYGRQEGRAKRP